MFCTNKTNTITYQGLTCSCDSDVMLKLNGAKGYECVCSDVKVIKKTYIPKFKTNIKLDECPTLITEIFNSKEFKKPLVICKGRLLEVGEKTRIVKVNK